MKWSEPPPGLKKEEGDSKKFGTVSRILPEFGDCPLISYAMEGFWTFPDFRHVVQTRMRRMVPSTTARTRCKFGFQRRLVTLCACEMLLPKRGPFPQISQTLAMISPYKFSLIPLVSSRYFSRRFSFYRTTSTILNFTSAHHWFFR